MAVTHDDIAKKVGVSRAIVTRALHGTPGLRVSEDTLRAIHKAAEELGYRPRHMTTRNIGFITRWNDLFSQPDLAFARHLEQGLRQHGYRLMLVNPDLPDDQELAQILNPKTVDGLLFGHWAGGRYASLSSRRLPCILLSEEDDIPADIEQIGADLTGTFRVICEHLRSRGHGRIALLSASHASSPFFRRVERAAIAAQEDVGFDSFRIVHDAPSLIHHAVIELLRAPQPPTALIASDDQRAVCVLNGLHQAGFRVPRDVSLVSLLDSPVLEVLTPSITATTAVGSVLADAAVSRLLQKISVPETIARHLFVSGELVERGSVQTL